MGEPHAGPAWQVVEITSDETHPVRLAVLRADTPTKTVTFAEDDWPGAVHLGVRLDGEVVATSTWIPRPLPSGLVALDEPDVDREPDTAMQLRGMATMQHLQGTGVGAALIAAGCERALTGGHTIVWANARDRALAFYEREGFEVVGDGFIDTTTQLPHHVVLRRL